jgi:hypothetical protein
MDSTAATEEFEPARPSSSFDDAPTEARRPPIPAIPSSREQCSACGAPLASDQRYCVECGQRRGGAGAPFAAGAKPALSPVAAVAHPRRALMSINATLIAGVGTLLLAMGIGILIGRSGQGAAPKAPAVQLISPGGSTFGASAGSTATETPSAGASTTSTTSTTPTSSSKPSGSASPKTAPKKSRPPAPKVVTVGSKGNGPGYQKGKFTGNFFGEGEN